MRVAAKIELTSQERRRLKDWATAQSTPVRLRDRAQIVLLAAEGLTNKTIASELGLGANKVGRWRSRVATEGVLAIEKERPRGANHGGKDSGAQAELRIKVVEATTQAIPAHATQWSCRSMAQHLGTTHSFVNRVWRAHGLKPHLIRPVELGNVPHMENKLKDMVGLYLDPPYNAVAFSFEENHQALERNLPGLPKDRGTITYDDMRHGTKALFAALHVAAGETVGKTWRKHRHQEMLRFLREVEKTVPQNQDILLVLDNYVVHNHEKVLGWIERKKRIFLHFTPNRASWANLVDRFFAMPTDGQLRRGVSMSLPRLVQCLREFAVGYDKNPQPFVWTKTRESLT